MLGLFVMVCAHKNQLKMTFSLVVSLAGRFWHLGLEQYAKLCFGEKCSDQLLILYKYLLGHRFFKWDGNIRYLYWLCIEMRSVWILMSSTRNGIERRAPPEAMNTLLPLQLMLCACIKLLLMANLKQFIYWCTLRLFKNDCILGTNEEGFK